MRIMFLVTFLMLDVKTEFKASGLTEMEVVMLTVAQYGYKSNDMDKCCKAYY